MSFHILKPSPYQYFDIVRYTPPTLKWRDEMKSAKDAEKRYEDMKQFFTSRRQDRGDRVEKVADYIKNLKIDSEDESISEDEEEFKSTQSNKKKNEMEGFSAGKMNTFLKKKKAGVASSSSSTTETSSTIGLSDLSLDSDEDDLDDVVKDPFDKKKNEKNQKTSKSRKPKYEDMNKAGKKSLDVGGLLDANFNLDKKANVEKKVKGSAEKVRQAATSGKTNMKELQKHLEKRLTKLSEQNGPPIDMTKLKKNKKPTTTSDSSDLSPEEEFFRYLQGTKGKKILESIGKKVDVSPASKTSIEESLADFGRKASKPSTKTGQSTKVTEPPRPVLTKKLSKEPTAAKVPDMVQKTGAISKAPTRDTSIKTKMSVAGKESTKMGALSKEPKAMATKSEAKPDKLDAIAKKLLKKAPSKK